MSYAYQSSWCDSQSLSSRQQHSIRRVALAAAPSQLFRHAQQCVRSMVCVLSEYPHESFGQPNFKNAQSKYVKGSFHTQHRSHYSNAYLNNPVGGARRRVAQLIHIRDQVSNVLAIAQP